MKPHFFNSFVRTNSAFMPVASGKVAAVIVSIGSCAAMASGALVNWDAEGGSNTNWHIGDGLFPNSFNWTSNADPLAADDVTFATAGALTTGVTNTVNQNFTIQSLTYDISSATLKHTTSIGEGNTLTVSGGNVRVGVNATNAGGANNVILTGGGNFSHSFSGGTFAVGAVGAGGASGANGAATTASLDAKGLASFSVDVGATGAVRLGDSNNPGSTGGGATTATLAPTSNITAGVLGVGDQAGRANITHALRLGSGVNTLHVNTFNIGANDGTVAPGAPVPAGENFRRSEGAVLFDSGSGSLVLRDATGGATGTLNILNTLSNTGQPITSTMDLSGHEADIAVANLNMGIRRDAASNHNSGNAALTFNSGNLSVGTATLGSYVSTGATARTNVINLNIGGGTASFGAINMAQSDTAGSTVNATLNLTGGTTTLSGDITRVGGAGVSNARIILSNADTILDMAGNDIGTAASTVAITGGGGTLKNVGTFNGENGLILNTPGTLVLDGTNTFAGGSITTGTVSLKNPGAIPSGGNFTVTAPGTVALRVGDDGSFGATDIDNLLAGNFPGVTFDGAANAGVDTGFNEFTYSSSTPGSNGLTKVGTGTLVLTGVEYTGTTLINEGTVRLSGGGNRLSPAGSIAFGGVASLDLDGNSQTTAGLSMIGIPGAATSMITGGDLTVTGGDLVVQPGGSGSSISTLDMVGLATFTYNVPAGNVKIGGGTTVLAGQTGNLMLASTANTITASAVQVGAFGGLTSVINSAKLTLGKANTINASVFSAGGVTRSNATVEFGSFLDPTLTLRGTEGGSSRTNITVANNSGGSTGSSSTVNLNSGEVDILADVILVGVYNVAGLANTAGAFLFNGGTIDANSVVLSRRVSAVSQGGTTTGRLTQGGGTLKTATLSLGENATTSGTSPAIVAEYILSAGTLAAQTIKGGPNAVEATSSSRKITWNGGVIRNFDAATDLAINGMGAGNGRLGINVTGAATAEFVADSARSITVDGNVIVSGAGLLTVAGPGTVVLAGANTHAGGTSVTGGTLLATNSTGSATGTGAVTVAASATVGGTGSIAGATTVSGSVAPGTPAMPVSTLGFGGDLTLDASSVYQVTVASDGAANDKLAVVGALAANGTINVTFMSPYVPTAGKQFDVADAASFTGTPTVTGTLPAGLAWNTSLLASAGVIEVVSTGGGDPYADFVAGIANPEDRGPQDDPDFDGIQNAIEFVIGGNAASGNDAALLPTSGFVTADVGNGPTDYVKFTYRRTTASAYLSPVVEFDTDLAGPWTAAVSGSAGVVIQTNVPAAFSGTVDRVDVYIPRSLAAAGKLFTRLQVSVP